MEARSALRAPCLSGCLPGPLCLDQACLSWQVLDSWPQGLPKLKPAPSQSLAPRRGGWGWKGQQGTEAEPGNWGPKPSGLDSVYLISSLGRSGKAWPLAIGSETSQPEGLTPVPWASPDLSRLHEGPGRSGPLGNGSRAGRPISA